MTTNLVSLDSLSIAQLTALYNLYADKAVVKFSTKPIALRRVAALGLGDVANPNGGTQFTLQHSVAGEPVDTVLAEDETEDFLEPAILDEEEPADEPAEEPAEEPAVTAAEPAQPYGAPQPPPVQAALNPAPAASQAPATAPAPAAPPVKTPRGFGALVKAAKAAKAPKATGKRGPPPVHADDDVISVMCGKNPKRPGSSAHERFSLYRDGMTVKEYLEACAALQGGSPAKYRMDLHWDHERHFIGSHTARQIANSAAGRDMEDDGAGA